MLSAEEYLYGLATTLFVAVCIVIATVRWFHMCHPYDRHPDYYYPGRRAMTLIYLMPLVLVPCIILPSYEGAWLLAKAYFLPGSIYLLSIMLFSYFATVKHWRKWRRPTVIIGIIALLALCTGPAIALLGGDHVYNYKIGHLIIYGLGLLMTGFCIFAVSVVLRWVALLDPAEYSNPLDFPVTFARRMVALLMTVVVLLWVAAIANNRVVMAVLEILMAGFSVVLLVSALHPHRHQEPAEEEQEEEALADGAPQVYSYNLSPAKTRAIDAAIRKVVEEQEAFLEPHLTVQDVATRCGYNRTYVAGVFKTRLGGFFNYVNTLRLNYADAYRTEHPAASLTEIVDASGFSSRSSYYAVKAKLQK